MRLIFSTSVFLFLSNILFSQESHEIKIIEKRILYNTEREKLSIQYLKERHGIIKQTPSITPKFIVLHYTAGGSVSSNFNYFNNVRIENSRELNKSQSLLNVSSHYLIDSDGTIYHLVDDTLFARHTIGLNYCAIGIENIGSDTKPLTKEQVVANANLIRHLCKKYKIEFVIGHSEYTLFRKSDYWKETNPTYITYKNDPGDSFLAAVRKLIIDLHLKSRP